MSIHPENHWIETCRLLKPNIVVITNARRDHTEAMGADENEIASVLALDIAEDSTVFIPEREIRPAFLDAAEERGSKLVPVKEGASLSRKDSASVPSGKEFAGNTGLVHAVAGHLNIDERTVAEGIRKTRYDIGSFTIWRYTASGRSVYVVNGFAANDPESTRIVFDKAVSILPSAAKCTGFLNLRSDRGERTLQWIDALKAGMFDAFTSLYAAGMHARAVKRRLGNVRIVKDKKPERIMETLTAGIEDGSVIFGFGNMAGAGKMLVEHWKETGKEYGI